MFDISEAFFLIIILTPVYALVRLLVIRKKKIEKNFLRELSMFLLFVCVCFVLIMTILPKLIIMPDNSVRIMPGSSSINMKPFSFINEIKSYIDMEIYSAVVFNLFGNIIPFAAISLLCALLFKHFQKFYRVLLYGLAFTIVIELIQIPIARGTDIDDVILNVFGFVLGYLAFKLTAKLFPKLAEKLNN